MNHIHLIRNAGKPRFLKNIKGAINMTKKNERNTTRKCRWLRVTALLLSWTLLSGLMLPGAILPTASANPPWEDNVLMADFKVAENPFDSTKNPKARVDDIKSATFVVFCDNLKGMQDALYSWDVSEAQDGSVMAWYKLLLSKRKPEYIGGFALYIGAEGGVNASLACERLFADCSELKIVYLDDCHTTGATSMKEMFYNCTSLRELDLTGLDTSSVTDMSAMFYGLSAGCELTIDLDTFDTSNVTEYDKFMYYGDTINGIPWTDLFE